jgi:hypothetical protein
LALDFPNDPVIGQHFLDWHWDGTKWVRRSPSAVTVSPTQPVGSFLGDLWYDGTMLRVWDGVKWDDTGAAVSFGPNPPANPVNGMLWWDINAGRLYIWDVTQWVGASQPASTGDGGGGGDVTQAQLQAALANYLPLAGGKTMTGLYYLAGDAESGTQPVTLQQMTNAIAGIEIGEPDISGLLPLSGGVLTGSLTLAGPGAANSNQAVTVNQLNAAIAGLSPGAGGGITSLTAGTGLTGGTITTSGTIALSVPVSIANGGTGATSGAAALNALAGVSGSTTGALQRSSTGTWSVTAVSGFLPTTGGTMTGQIALPATNASGNQAVRFAQVQSMIGAYLPLSGGTMTGAITLPASNVSGNQAIRYAQVASMLTPYATVDWVNNNFATYAWVSSNYVSIASFNDYFHMEAGAKWFSAWQSGGNFGAQCYILAGSLGMGWIQWGVNWVSDVRLKEAIRPSAVDALSCINQVPLRDFVMKRDGYHNRLGLIAQEVQPHMPEMVVERPDQYLSIEPERAIPYLMKAIQQLSDEIEQLKRGR